MFEVIPDGVCHGLWIGSVRAHRPLRNLVQMRQMQRRARESVRRPGAKHGKDLEGGEGAAGTLSIASSFAMKDGSTCSEREAGRSIGSGKEASVGSPLQRQVVSARELGWAGVFSQQEGA